MAAVIRSKAELRVTHKGVLSVPPQLNRSASPHGSWQNTLTNAFLIILKVGVILEEKSPRSSKNQVVTNSFSTYEIPIAAIHRITPLSLAVQQSMINGVASNIKHRP